MADRSRRQDRKSVNFSLPIRGAFDKMGIVVCSRAVTRQISKDSIKKEGKRNGKSNI